MFCGPIGIGAGLLLIGLSIMISSHIARSQNLFVDYLHKCAFGKGMEERWTAEDEGALYELLTGKKSELLK
jgi:hypothetical protein